MASNSAERYASPIIEAANTSMFGLKRQEKQCSPVGENVIILLSGGVELAFSYVIIRITQSINVREWVCSKHFHLEH